MLDYQTPETSMAIAFAVTDMWLSVLVEVQVIWCGFFALRKRSDGCNHAMEVFDAFVILKLSVLYNVLWLSVGDLCLAYKLWIGLSERSFKYAHLQTWCTVTSVLTIVKVCLAIPYVWYLVLDTSYEWFLNIFCFLLLHLLFKFLFIKVLHQLRREMKEHDLVREFMTQAPAKANVKMNGTVKINHNQLLAF